MQRPLGKLDSRYTVNSSTKVIYVPADRSATAKYKVSNGSTYFRTGETYYLQLIDIDGYTVKAAVVFGGAGNASDFAVSDSADDCNKFRNEARYN